MSKSTAESADNLPNQDQPIPGALSSRAQVPPKKSHPRRLLKAGYYSGLIAFFICLILTLVCTSLFLYSTYFWLDSLGGAQITQQFEVQINGRLVMARIALLSVGMLSGISFGFLGFSLFLLGAEGSIDAKFEGEGYKATLSRMSPGAVVIIAASILIGVCASRETPFWYERSSTFDTDKNVNRDPTTDSSNMSGHRDLPPKLHLDKP